MIQLLIIADDFTGALDTSVCFVAHGARARVITNFKVDFSVYAEETDVLVIDSETRHLDKEDAYQVVKEIGERAAAMQIPYLYKKTDSALRGNIGAELTAMMDGVKEHKLAFIPAYPEIARCTVNGIQMIGEVPVAESVFGKDPFEPVIHSAIADIIQEQSAINTYAASVDKTDLVEDGIYIFDATTQKELELIGERLFANGNMRISAGCAGFGAVLPKLFGWKQKEKTVLPKLDQKFTVVCGSVNPITLEQLGDAEKHGFYRYRMTPEQKLSPFKGGTGNRFIQELKQALASHPYRIIDSNDTNANEATRQYACQLQMSTEEVRKAVSTAIGQIVSNLFDSPDLGTLLITGGDVLKQCMDSMEVYEMEPIGEMLQGVVLAKFKKDDCVRYVITKSGGFGDKTLINDLVKMIEDQNNLS